MPDSLQPHGLQSAKLLCPWNFPGKYTGVGCTPPAIKFFTIRILYPLSHQGSPKSIPKYWCHLPIFRTSALFSKYHNSALFRKNRICIYITFKHNLVKKIFFNFVIVTLVVPQWTTSLRTSALVLFLPILSLSLVQWLVLVNEILASLKQTEAWQVLAILEFFFWEHRPTTLLEKECIERSWNMWDHAKHCE